VNPTFLNSDGSFVPKLNLKYGLSLSKPSLPNDVFLKAMTTDKGTTPQEALFSLKFENCPAEITSKDEN
jgi:hypothetical protein